MVHLLGAGLLGIAAAIPGCMQARKTILEYRILQQLSEAVQIMHSELSCNLVTVQELFTQAAACGKPLDMLFHAAAMQLAKDPYCTAETAMQTALEQSPRLIQDLATRRILLQLARMLGQYDFESQQRSLRYSGEQITGHLKELAAEKKARSKSAGALGLCGGAALFIILV